MPIDRRELDEETIAEVEEVIAKTSQKEKAGRRFALRRRKELISQIPIDDPFSLVTETKTDVVNEGLEQPEEIEIEAPPFEEISEEEITAPTLKDISVEIPSSPFPKEEKKVSRRRAEKEEAAETIDLGENKKKRGLWKRKGTEEKIPPLLDREEKDILHAEPIVEMVEEGEVLQVCPSCGYQNLKEALFCVDCGIGLSDVDLPLSLPDGLEEAPADESLAVFLPEKEETPKKAGDPKKKFSLKLALKSLRDNRPERAKIQKEFSPQEESAEERKPFLILLIIIFIMLCVMIILSSLHPSLSSTIAGFTLWLR